MSEWKFKRDTQFRKLFFTPESWSHPAKMDAQLLIKIVETYTQPGETILDTMAGSGTTMLACGLGRNVILLELEARFCQMCRDNWEKVRMHPHLGYQMGTCQIIQGDSRNLENILCDKIITSPPYAETTLEGTNASRFHIDWLKRTGRNINTPHTKIDDRYAPSEENIGNLPYGNIDSIITSPPYEGSLEASSRHTKGGIPSRDKKLGQTGSYADFDKAEIEAKISAGFQSEEARKKIASSARGYSASGDNIGNLRADSYLSAMFRVYQQCHKVLKPQGLMILVVKNFLRNQKEVDLRADTIKLCELSGFQLLEEHHRILPSQSFWRVIYAQRFPNAPKIDREYILAFQKL